MIIFNFQLYWLILVSVQWTKMNEYDIEQILTKCNIFVNIKHFRQKTSYV